MDLMKDIDLQARLHPLKEYLDGVNEDGIELDNEVIAENVMWHIEQLVGELNENLEPVNEVRQGEFQAARQLSGDKPFIQTRKQQAIAKELEGSKRLGMVKGHPDKADIQQQTPVRLLNGKKGVISGFEKGPDGRPQVVVKTGSFDQEYVNMNDLTHFKSPKGEMWVQKKPQESKYRV